MSIVKLKGPKTIKAKSNLPKSLDRAVNSIYAKETRDGFIDPEVRKEAVNSGINLATDYYKNRHFQQGWGSLEDPTFGSIKGIGPNSGTLSTYGESKYDPDVITPTSEALNDAREANQGVLDAIGNGIATFGLTAANTGVTGTVGGIYGLLKAAATLDYTALWDNDILKLQNTLQDKIAENYQTYANTAQTQDGSFSLNNLTSGNFWAGTIANGLGFVTGAAASSYAIGGLLGNVTSLTANALTKGAGYVKGSEILNTLRTVNLGAKTNAVLASAIAATSESGLEAQMAYNEALESANKLNRANYDLAVQQLALDYEVGSPEYEAALNKLNTDFQNGERVSISEAKKAAGITYALNQVTVGASNYLTFAKGLMGGYKGSQKVINGIKGNAKEIFEAKKAAAKVIQQQEARAAAGITADAATEIAEKEILDKAAQIAFKQSTANKYIEGSRIFKNFLNEGFEEYAQSAISTGAKEGVIGALEAYHAGKYDPESMSNYSDYVTNVFKNLTPNEQNTFEFFVGGLLGMSGAPILRVKTNDAGKKTLGVEVAGGIKEAYDDYKERREERNDIIDKLNSTLSNPKLKDNISMIVRDGSFTAAMKEALSEGNVFEYQNAKHAALYNQISYFNAAGKLDQLIDVYEGVINDLTVEEASGFMDSAKQSGVESSINANGEIELKPTTIEVSPFRDSRGNLLSEEEFNDVKKKILDNFRKQVESYKRNSEYLYGLLGDRLTNDELDELGYLYSAYENMSSREAELANKVGHLLNGNKEIVNKVLASYVSKIAGIATFSPEEIVEAINNRNTLGDTNKATKSALSDGALFLDSVNNFINKAISGDTKNLNYDDIAPVLKEFLNTIKDNEEAVAKYSNSIDSSDILKDITDILSLSKIKGETLKSFNNYLKHPDLVTEALRKVMNTARGRYTDFRASKLIQEAVDYLDKEIDEKGEEVITDDLLRNTAIDTTNKINSLVGTSVTYNEVLEQILSKGINDSPNIKYAVSQNILRSKEIAVKDKVIEVLYHLFENASEGIFDRLAYLNSLSPNEFIKFFKENPQTSELWEGIATRIEAAPLDNEEFGYFIQRMKDAANFIKDIKKYEEVTPDDTEYVEEKKPLSDEEASSPLNKPNPKFSGSEEDIDNALRVYAPFIERIPDDILQAFKNTGNVSLFDELMKEVFYTFYSGNLSLIFQSTLFDFLERLYPKAGLSLAFSERRKTNEPNYTKIAKWFKVYLNKIYKEVEANPDAYTKDKVIVPNTDVPNLIEKTNKAGEAKGGDIKDNTEEKQTPQQETPQETPTPTDKVEEEYDSFGKFTLNGDFLKSGLWQYSIDKKVNNRVLEELTIEDLTKAGFSNNDASLILKANDLIKREGGYKLVDEGLISKEEAIEVSPLYIDDKIQVYDDGNPVLLYGISRDNKFIPISLVNAKKLSKKSTPENKVLKKITDEGINSWDSSSLLFKVAEYADGAVLYTKKDDRGKRTPNRQILSKKNLEEALGKTIEIAFVGEENKLFSTGPEYNAIKNYGSIVAKKGQPFLLIKGASGEYVAVPMYSNQFTKESPFIKKLAEIEPSNELINEIQSTLDTELSTLKPIKLSELSSLVKDNVIYGKEDGIQLVIHPNGEYQINIQKNTYDGNGEFPITNDYIDIPYKGKDANELYKSLVETLQNTLVNSNLYSSLSSELLKEANRDNLINTVSTGYNTIVDALHLVNTGFALQPYDEEVTITEPIFKRISEYSKSSNNNLIRTTIEGLADTYEVVFNGNSFKAIDINKYSEGNDISELISLDTDFGKLLSVFAYYLNGYPLNKGSVREAELKNGDTTIGTLYRVQRNGNNLHILKTMKNDKPYYDIYTGKIPSSVIKKFEDAITEEPKEDTTVEEKVDSLFDGTYTEEVDTTPKSSTNDIFSQLDKIKTTAEKVTTEENYDDIDALFRTVNDITTEKRYTSRDFSKELEVVRSIIPDIGTSVAIRVVNGYLNAASKGAYSLGSFDGSVITISNMATVGTLYHEAFHVLMHNIVSKEEANSILEDAKAYYKVDDIVDAEEKLAEAFREYALTREKVKPEGIWDKVRKLFKALFTIKNNHAELKQKLDFFIEKAFNGAYASDKAAIPSLQEYRIKELKDGIKDILVSYSGRVYKANKYKAVITNSSSSKVPRISLDGLSLLSTSDSDIAKYEDTYDGILSEGSITLFDAALDKISSLQDNPNYSLEYRDPSEAILSPIDEALLAERYNYSPERLKAATELYKTSDVLMKDKLLKC